MTDGFHALSRAAHASAPSPLRLPLPVRLHIERELVTSDLKAMAERLARDTSGEIGVRQEVRLDSALSSQSMSPMPPIGNEHSSDPKHAGGKSRAPQGSETESAQLQA